MACTAAGLPDVQCTDMAACDAEALLQPPAAAQQGPQGGGGLAAGTAVLVVVSTHEGGSPPESAKWFCRCDACCLCSTHVRAHAHMGSRARTRARRGLEESAADFRVGSRALAHLAGFAVFGCGNGLYREVGGAWYGPAQVCAGASCLMRHI